MMRILKAVLLSAVVLAAGSAHAQYDATITLASGSLFKVRKLNIKGDRLYGDTANVSAAISMIESVEFHFRALNLGLCNSMFRSGDLKALEGLLQQYVAPVMKYSNLQGNLSDYLIWMGRVQYWNRNAAAEKTLGLIVDINDPDHVDTARLYQVLLLLDAGNAAEAGKLFSAVAEPETVSVPMALYIRARLAFENGKYPEALKLVSRMVAFHYRDVEWMAPATAFEADIYLAMGRPQKAAVVAQELIMAYPGSQWSTKGETIMNNARAKE